VSDPAPQLRAVVDPDVCYGSGECVRRASAAFELHHEGYAVATGQVGGLSEDDLLSIARTCPSAAITIYNGDRVVHQGGV
jgi:ferredoxin